MLTGPAPGCSPELALVLSKLAWSDWAVPQLVQQPPVKPGHCNRVEQALLLRA